MPSLDSFFASLPLPLMSDVAHDLTQPLDIMANEPALSANWPRASFPAHHSFTDVVGA